jgi:hypothetical protein
LLPFLFLTLSLPLFSLPYVPPLPVFFSSHLFGSSSDFYRQRMQVFFGNGRCVS